MEDKLRLLMLQPH